MRRFLAVLLVLLCLGALTACGGDDGGSGGDGDSAEDASEQMQVNEEPEEEEELDNEEIVEQAQDFWEDHAEDIGFEYQELDDDFIFSIEEDDLPTCDGLPFPAEQFEDNAAAVNCAEGLMVAWDPDYLDDRRDVAGEAGPVVTFSHEFGHIIQYETGLIDQLESVYIENQADCFAGAFVAEQVDDEWGPFVDPAATDRALVARLSSADPIGFDPGDVQAHGSGFDRVRAFQDGFNQGVEYCADYVNDPPHIDERLFTTDEDFANQGNLPFDDVVDLVEADLEDWFDDNVDDFEDPDDPFELFDEDDLEDLHGEIGDGVVPTVLGLTWAQAAQEAVGEDTEGEGPFLQRACVVGAWLGDILRDQYDGQTERESGAQLSPGDLDEAIATLLELSEQGMEEGGVAFEAIFDMRQGVFGSLDDCRLGD